MIRRPPRSTLDRSSAASDVYKRQTKQGAIDDITSTIAWAVMSKNGRVFFTAQDEIKGLGNIVPVSYTHLRAHETVLDLVCRLLLEKKKKTDTHTS